MKSEDRRLREARHDRSLWRNREFMALWSGQLVSTVGTRITAVGYPLLVLALTHSPLRAGLVGFAQTLPLVALSLPAGALVDRFDRKIVMLTCEAGRALALGSIPVALALGRLEFVQIVVVALIEGSLLAFFGVAEGAALPHVVKKEQLSAAMAQNEARIQGASVVGRPLGGVLFELSRAAPFAADAISYLASFVTLLLLRSPLKEDDASQERRSLLREIREGTSWIWHDRFMRTVVVLAATANFLFASLSLALIVRARGLGASPALIGLMFAFYGIGGIIGAIAAPRAVGVLRRSSVLIIAMWFWSCGTALMVVAPTTITLGIIAGAMTAVNAPFNVVVGNYKYAIVPDRLMGRFHSVTFIVAFGAMPVAWLATGALLGALGARWTLALLAAGALSVAAAATITPTLRSVPDSSLASKTAS